MISYLCLKMLFFVEILVKILMVFLCEFEVGALLMYINS